jgi:hypothetical protein
VEEVREAWTRGRRRSVVPIVIPGRGGEGWAEGAVPKRFNVEEERGTDVEAHVEDT